MALATSSPRWLQIASLMTAVGLIAAGVLMPGALEGISGTSDPPTQVFSPVVLDLTGEVVTGPTVTFGNSSSNGGFAPGDSGQRYVLLRRPRIGTGASLNLQGEVLSMTSKPVTAVANGPRDTPRAEPARAEDLTDIAVTVDSCPAEDFDAGTEACSSGWVPMTAARPLSGLNDGPLMPGLIEPGPPTLLRISYRVAQETVSGDRLQGSLVRLRMNWTLSQVDTGV